MVLRRTIEDREWDKFDQDTNGDTAVRIIGKFSSAGLRNGGKITHVTINDSTWTALPPTALANRNAISIQNQSGTEMKMEYDNTVSDYSGVKIIDSSERFYDITDTIIVYGKCDSGTAIITIEELS